MYRHSSEVLPDDLRSMAVGVDPTAPGTGSHLNFDQVLRRCGYAWMALLHDLDVLGTGVIVPRVEVDYAREVGVGDLHVDVTVLSLGRTSFRLAMRVEQHGAQVARAEAVLVAFDYATRTPRPLTGAERTALAAHLEEPAEG